MQHRANQRGPEGFTLVELAIVVTIIGLLIGGVLNGRELLEHAKVRFTQAQITSYQTAVVTFQDKYGAYPGDFRKAQQRLPGCVRDIMCHNGSGDGFVGPVHLDIENASKSLSHIWLPFAGALASVSYNQQQTPTWQEAIEPNMFWKHLALADLIKGVNPEALFGAEERLNPVFGQQGQSAWGQTHPMSAFKAGLHVTYIAIAGRGGRTGRFPRGRVTYPGVEPGHYFLYRSRMDDGGEANGLLYMFLNPTMGGVLPRRAMALDRKRDDGDPNRGDIVIGGIPENVCGLWTGGEGSLDEGYPHPSCFIFARFE